MPPMTLISHLAGLQHAQAIEIAESRHRLFRRPMTAGAHRRSAQVIALPTVDVVDRPARVA